MARIGKNSNPQQKTLHSLGLATVNIMTLSNDTWQTTLQRPSHTWATATTTDRRCFTHFTTDTNVQTIQNSHHHGWWLQSPGLTRQWNAIQHRDIEKSRPTVRGPVGPVVRMVQVVWVVQSPPRDSPLPSPPRDLWNCGHPDQREQKERNWRREKEKQKGFQSVVRLVLSRWSGPDGPGGLDGLSVLAGPSGLGGPGGPGGQAGGPGGPAGGPGTRGRLQ